MKRRVFSIIVLVVMIVSVIAPINAMAATKVKILKVTVDSARLRYGPSSSYGVKTSLKKGAKVFYLGKTENSFAHICTSKGLYGYMYKGYLKSYGSCNKSQVYYNKKKTLPVYKKASTSSKRVTKLSKYQHVIVYGFKTKGSWAYIKTLGGKGGYCKASALTKAF